MILTISLLIFCFFFFFRFFTFRIIIYNYIRARCIRTRQQKLLARRVTRVFVESRVAFGFCATRLVYPHTYSFIRVGLIPRVHKREKTLKKINNTKKTKNNRFCPFPTLRLRRAATSDVKPVGTHKYTKFTSARRGGVCSSYNKSINNIIAIKIYYRRRHSLCRRIRDAAVLSFVVFFFSPVSCNE